MDENERTEIETAEQVTPETPPADTGHETEELRAQIEALRSETEKLTRELAARLEPDKKPESGNAAAYFRGFLKP